MAKIQWCFTHGKLQLRNCPLQCQNFVLIQVFETGFCFVLFFSDIFFKICKGSQAKGSLEDCLQSLFGKSSKAFGQFKCLDADLRKADNVRANMLQQRVSQTHWKQELLPSSPCSYNFFQLVLSEEMYGNIPACSETESWLTPSATMTLPEKWDFSPVNDARSKVPTPGTAGEFHLCSNTSMCVSLLSKRLGPRAAEQSTVAGLQKGEHNLRHCSLLQLTPLFCLCAKKTQTNKQKK